MEQRSVQPVAFTQQEIRDPAPVRENPSPRAISRCQRRISRGRGGHPFIGRFLPLTALLWTGLALQGCATFPGMGGPSLREDIESVILAPPLDQVHWGILIVDPETGETLYSRNAHRKFVPASNMKILSTATAISLLGPDHQFETTIWGVGELDPDAGILSGDLVLRPSGDPTFSERFYPSAQAPFDSLALSLRRAGVRQVTGSLVVDVSLWDSTTVPGSWMVGNLPYRSAATGGALAMAEGELVVEVTAGPSQGSVASSRWWPATPENFFSSAFVTVHPDSSFRSEVHYLPESRRLQLAGSIPVGSVDTVSVAQRDPVSIASANLLRALKAQDITVAAGLRLAWEMGGPLGPGNCVTGRPPVKLEEGKREEEVAPRSPPGPTLPDCPGARRLAGIESPPMAEIVEAILEPSQNWMTEQLVRALGAEFGEEGSWEAGFEVEQEFLTTRVGVDSLDLHFRDGSGLAAYNLVTPRAMVQILRFLRDSPHGGLYRLAMAEPGEDPGTLRNRLQELEGQLFAKTGTISHVNSLSGYLLTNSGRELVFSILTNGSGLPSSAVRRGIDRVVEATARH